jgi:sugar phosphate isomerase/epimerase
MASSANNVRLGVNMEYCRHADKSFEDGVAIAAKIGFEYVEPMVHSGRQVLCECEEKSFFHSVSLADDPLRIKNCCAANGVKVSALSNHCCLCKPDYAVDFLKQGIRFAAEIGAPIVNTDDGVKAKWTTKEEDFVLMKYTLREACFVAEPRGIMIGFEPHQLYSTNLDDFDRIVALPGSPAMGVNFDTGNSYLSGQDPYSWMERVKDKIIHIHAKDIPKEQSDAERGKVTGTAVGCACGDGMIDWARVVEILKTIPRTIVMSVECGSIEQAERSFKYLSKLV